jgi:selenocysteine lyase/cysteine desulfurase
MRPIDVAAARHATPGCEHLAFLNNAGSALPTQRTLDAVIGHLYLESEVGGYEAEDSADVWRVVRNQAGALFDVPGEEIALAGSESAAFAKIFWGLLNGGSVPDGSAVAVDRLSYNSHYLALLQARKRHGLRIVVLPSRADGSTDTDGLERSLSGVALASTTVLGTHSGVVNDIAAVGQVCRALGIPHVVDACQAVGQTPVDPRRLGCDALTATGRKWLRGPRGTGLLWVDPALAERCEPFGIDGLSAAWLDADRYELATGAERFEEFEVPVAAFAGLAAAIAQVLELGIDAIHDRVVALARRLRSELAERPALTVHEPVPSPSGIVTFSVDGHDAPPIAAAARQAGVSINTSSAPWARLDMAAKGLTTVVRVSPHYYNTDGELDRLLDVVDGVISRAS